MLISLSIEVQESKGVVVIYSSLILGGSIDKQSINYKMRTRSTSTKIITESTILNIDIIESIADFLGK